MEREKWTGGSVLQMTFFDPLDRELLERALEAAHAALNSNCPGDALESEALEHALRRELIELLALLMRRHCAISPYVHLNKVGLHLRRVRLWHQADQVALLI
jgi:hypothetical protein